MIVSDSAKRHGVFCSMYDDDDFWSEAHGAAHGVDP